MLTIENALEREAVGMYQGLLWFRERPQSLVTLFYGWKEGSNDGTVMDLWAALGPKGWMDANISFASECNLLFLGEPGLCDWRSAGERSKKVRDGCSTPNLGEIPLPNPRRFLAAIAIPNIGNIHTAAAETLFKRRCLIIACCLERHRLATGGFPDSLTPLQAELAAFEIKSPHRNDDSVSYRKERSGYLLWSPGPDAVDQNGDPSNDWVWRHR
jgi:hypothetical protein